MLISKFDTYGIEQKVIQFEATYNIQFPSQYKKFILKYNGGHTPDTTFKVKPRRNEDVISFYGIGVEEECSLEKHPWIDERIGNGYLPIADDDFGNEYLIGIAKENYGKIYFYDHEEQTAEFVRNDFNEFIVSCKSKKLDKSVRKTVAEREADLIARGLAHNITDGLRRLWQEEIDFYGNMVQEPVILDESEN